MRVPEERGHQTEERETFERHVAGLGGQTSEQDANRNLETEEERLRCKALRRTEKWYLAGKAVYALIKQA